MKLKKVDMRRFKEKKLEKIRKKRVKNKRKRIKKKMKKDIIK
jgi:hypothetical protein